MPTTGHPHHSMCNFPLGHALSHPRDAPEGNRVDGPWPYLTSKLVLEAALTIQQTHHLDAA